MGLNSKPYGVSLEPCCFFRLHVYTTIVSTMRQVQEKRPLAFVLQILHELLCQCVEQGNYK